MRVEFRGLPLFLEPKQQVILNPSIDSGQDWFSWVEMAVVVGWGVEGGCGRFMWGDGSGGVSKV